MSVPSVGERVEVVFDDEHWYPGVVTKRTRRYVQVDYDDGTFVQHPRSEFRERYNWRYEDLAASGAPSCARVAYERDERDGTFYGHAARWADAQAEQEYAERCTEERARSEACPGLRGYVDDGFVVEDDEDV